MTVFDLQNTNKQMTAEKIPATVTALGTFDGVHIGHAALLREACTLASSLGSDVFPAVWTFFEPPFRGRVKYLTTLQEKLSLFARAGIRYVFLEEFSNVQMLPPKDFVSKILLAGCGVRGSVCGFNFRFGHSAMGTPAFLQKELANALAPVLITQKVTQGAEAGSSTRIRALLDAGDTEYAAQCLGRYYSVSLPVVHGKELGRKIGIPTINQNFPLERQTPLRGTYASTVSVDGVLYPGVTNVGIRPSITENDSHTPNAETHIIGYRGWRYDKSLRVYFRHRLRDEQAFPSLDALKAQIARDIDASNASFHEHKELCYG